MSGFCWSINTSSLNGYQELDFLNTIKPLIDLFNLLIDINLKSASVVTDTEEIFSQIDWRIFLGIDSKISGEK